MRGGAIHQWLFAATILGLATVEVQSWEARYSRSAVAGHSFRKAQELTVAPVRQVPKRDTIVIVRAHEPTEAMIERWQSFEADLHEHIPAAEFVISLDTSGSEFANQTVQRVQKALPGAMLHTYDFSAVRRMYPVLQNMKGRVVSGRYYHAECINMAMAFIQEHVALGAGAKVWVIEDDIGICGSLSNFINQYKKDNSDFIGCPIGGNVARDHWLHADQGSPEFFRKYPFSKRWHRHEMVERFSVPLLDHLNDLSRKRITALSEMFVATACINDGFQCGQLQREHAIWEYTSCGSRLSKVQWEAAKVKHQCSDKTGSIARYAHGLKW